MRTLAFLFIYLDEASVCVVGNWVDGWVRCVGVVFGDGIHLLLSGENNVGLLEGFL